MKEFKFEGSWRKFVVQENLEGHTMGLMVNARKIAREMGAMEPRLSKPTKFGAYTMFFPFDTGPSGAALTALGQRTMSGQRRDASMEKARNAANKFVEFLMQDGSPVDQGALGVDEGRTSYMVFLAPL
jgi:hypothetical protein